MQAVANCKSVFTMVVSIAKVKGVMVVARTVVGISVVAAAVSVPQGWVIGTIAIKPGQSAKVDTIPAASRLPSRYARSYVFAYIASFYLCQRRLDAALECAYAAHEAAEEQAIIQWQASAEIVIGAVLIKKGEHRDGQNRVVAGRELFNTIKARFMLIFLAPTIAEAYCYCGEYAEGLKLLEEVEILSETGINYRASEIYRLRGNLLAASGAAPDKSEAAYREALVSTRRQEAKMLELIAATDLARNMRTQGRIPEAHDFLEPIFNRFTEGLDTPDLMDAKALLNEIA